MARSSAMRTAVFAVATLLAAAGCAGPARTPTPTPTPPPTPPPKTAPPAIQIVDEQLADLHLWVSNQSFDDDPIVLTVSIDGTEVIAQPFEVRGQHNWILFPLQVPSGRHVVHVRSGTGAEKQETFSMPGTGRQYAVIDYWNEPGQGGRHLSWRIQSTPIGFA
ncbi:hypothetical protein V6V47_19070 [Micromonospora sp. CPCC 205539]|uniref:hypothetical protein n=1 Tax=Micromonospora sp. CPCC 205539 TaxID=3122408 RepID=UPI002FF0957B